MPFDGDNLYTTENAACVTPQWWTLVEKFTAGISKSGGLSTKDIKRTNTSLYSPELLWLMWLDSRWNTNGGYRGSHDQQLFCSDILFVFNFCQEAFTNVFSDFFFHTQQLVTCGWRDESQKQSCLYSNIILDILHTHTHAHTPASHIFTIIIMTTREGRRGGTQEDAYLALHSNVCNLLGVWIVPLRYSAWVQVSNELIHSFIQRWDCIFTCSPKIEYINTAI